MFASLVRLKCIAGCNSMITFCSSFELLVCPDQYSVLYCLGAAFTRFQTLRLQKVFPAVLADQLISYGSCQFPTLGFVVERYKQVQAFVPEPFWKIRGMTRILEMHQSLFGQNL